ncbi:MAG: histidine phosphatase family protein [Chlamydiales bacterium]
MKRIYLCRHGETEWTLSGQHTGKTDVPLTQKGREEAAQLRQRLENIPFERVFSSPRIRALESCHGMDPEVDVDLEEWRYGDYEGITSLEIQKINPGWNIFKDGAPHGESPAEAAARADRVLKKISHYKGNIALFSHGHFLRLLAARFLGLEPLMGSHLLLSVSSLSVLSYEKGIPVIALWNEQKTV